MTSSVKVAKAWELAVISKISENGQYFVGGRDTLQLATKLIGLLAQQNQIPVQYEVVGDKFKASEGTYRVKIQVGSEECYGGGSSISEAKQAAALQALMTTKYVFEDLPPMLNPAPSTEVNPEQTEDVQHWEKYQYEDLESSCDDIKEEKPPTDKRKRSLSSEIWDNQFSVDGSLFRNGYSPKKQKESESSSTDKEDDEEADSDYILCVATLWDFAGKIQVASNRQYLVGGKECLKESKKLMGILSKQNDVQVEYEAVDDDLPLEEGEVMLKIIFGEESYFGSGESVDDAKTAAALQVLLKTDYKYKELPNNLTPAPSKAPALKVITEYPTELDGICLNNKSPPETETVSDTPKLEVHRSETKGELIADNGQYYVEGETVERQSQYLISTMASQNKILHKYEIIEKCKSSAWVNWIAVRLILGDEAYNGSGESETEAKKAAAMMALQKTKYRFKSQFLPAGLKPTPEQKSSELDSLEQGIEKLRRAPENTSSGQIPGKGPGSTAYLEEMETEKEMDLMISGVDMHAGSGQFIINAYVRRACKYLIARLASQNRFSVRYDLLGEKFKPENKKCKVKLKVKTEEYFGHGPTIRRAKKNASLKALRKTKYTFHYLPNYVKMVPGWNETCKTEAMNGNTVNIKSHSISQTEEMETESVNKQVQEEPMDVDPKQNNAKVKQKMEEELEEGEILDDDEDEEGEITYPQKNTLSENKYQKHSDSHLDRKQSGSVHQLSLAELGLPTSFAMK